MSNPLSQESEFEARRRHAQQSADLIQTLKERVSQLVARYYEHTSASSENSILLLDILLKEVLELAEKTVESVARDLEARDQSLLPALRNNPCQLLLAAIEELSTADLEDYVLDNFSPQQYTTIREVYKVIRRAIKNLREQARLSPDEVVQRFNASKDRYALDHEQQLLYFRQECDNQRDDRQSLNDRYRDNTAVQIWLRNDMDICRTIDEMTRLGYEEKELSDLFAYIVRAEILHEIANEARQLITGQSTKIPTDAVVKAALLDVMVRINNSRHWYCIYKPLVQIGIIAKGDFLGFKRYVSSLIGTTNPEINPRDLSAKMDSGTFSKDPIEQWKPSSTAPVNGTTFDYYKSLAQDFLNKISSCS